MVLDSILPVLAELIKNPIKNYIVIPIKRHISYAFKCDRAVEKLKEQTEQLAKKRIRLQESVDEAERNGEHIYENVTNWLSSAETEIQEAEQLIQSKEEVKKKCCVGLCPNLKTRYQLSKKATEKVVAIEEHLMEKVFYPLRVMILNQVMDALKGPCLNMIGVYGMGGIGKTTLAKEVYRKAVEEELFDFVVMVTVSRTPDLRRIQGEIADFLGLKFDVDEVPAGRASRLNYRLKNEKVLIILDDIWAELDLRSVGIPVGDELKRSKILLTSRRKDGLCFEMGTQKDFLLEVLLEDEARSLFEMTMGEANDPELPDILNEVVKRCAGLPFLVTIVATYLKNRELSAWRDTLKKLFDFENEELHEKVNKVLKSIYESLPSDEVKSFFLLCALFGGPNIPVRHLLTYAMGLGLFGNIIRLQDAREKLFQMIEKLKTESLLLDGDINGYVKMHDVVLDVARSIATKEQHAFYSISGHGLREWPSRDCTRIALSYCDINELPQGLEYPKSEIFSLFSNDLYLEIPDLFFEGFRELKVLNLTGMRFMSLPTSLHFLTNLHSLHFDRCQLGDVAIIGDLKQLEFLSFADSCIIELPKQIEQLNQLKLLNLTNCTKLKIFPANVLSKLSLLEELYMGNSFVKWDVEGNISVMELEELRHLTTLEIEVSDAKEMPNRLFFRGLERYRIFIGDGWTWDDTYEASKTLKLSLKTVIHMEDGLKELLRGTQSLYLDKINEIENLLYGIDGEGCRQLKHLHIRNDYVIPHIINSTMWASCHAFPILETLSLINLESLRDLFSPQLESIFNKMVIFSNLRSLIVRECGSLKYIFKSSTVKSLLQLKRLVIESCDFVQDIILTEESINKIVFHNLEFLCLGGLPNLKRFSNCYPIEFQSLKKMEIKECQKLRNIVSNISNRGDKYDIQSLFNDMVTFPNLQIMRVSDMENLEFIWHTSELMADSFYKLKSLTISSCKNLVAVFSSNMVRRFQRLEDLYIYYCPKIKEIYQLGELNSNEVALFELRHLKIKFMASLKRIWSSEYGDGFFSFPNLKSVEAYKCEVMEYVFPTSVACGLTSESFCKLKSLRISSCRNLLAVFSLNVVRRFQRLEELYLSGCPKIEEIYELGYLNSDDVAAFELRHLKIYSMQSLKRIWNCEGGDGIFNFKNLKTVVAHGCGVMKYVFPASIACALLQLEQLRVRRCGVEHIVGKESIESDNEAPHNFKFPELVFLRLQYLQELRSFYPKTYFCEWPKLKYLKVRGCHEAIKLDVKVCSNLEALTLDCENSIDFSIECFSRLKVIKLYILKDKGSGFPFGFLKRLHSLEKLVLNCNYSECMESILFDDETTVGKEENVTTIVPLKYLKVKDCDRLKYVALSSVSFQNLTTLHVAYCHKLENLVTTSIAKTMVHLMESCIVAKDGDDTKHDAIIFNQLKRLELQCFPTLIYLTVESCTRLRNIDASSSVSFQNLTTLHIAHCYQLENLVTTSTAKTMVHLMELRITHCEMIKEIVVKDGDNAEHEITFNQLKCLELIDLPTLYSFCSGNYVFHFPLLENVIVQECLRMKFFCGGVLSTPKLQGVRQYWKYEEEYWDGNFNATIASQCFRKEVLQNADKLYVIEDHSSSKAILANQLQLLNNLTKINVRDCDSVQVVFDLENVSVEGGHGLLPNLRKLQLIALPKLSELWNKVPMRMFDFKNLTWLVVQDCSNLKYAFTQFMALSLIKLEEIEIKNCKMMEAIIKQEEAEETKLPKMTLPSLQKISIIGCPTMKDFMSPVLSKEQNPRPDEEGIRKQIISMQERHEISMPKLEELKIDWDIIKHKLDGNNQPNFFSKLKVIELVFPYISFLTMEKLVLSDSLVEQIIIEGMDNHHELPPRLRKIVLSKLPNLEDVVYDNDSIFLNLQELQVWECNKLKTLVPSYVYFQNLTCLQVSKCNGMINLITGSTANSLVQLKKMYVGGCKMMQEIVAVEFDGEEDEIGFLQLEYLVLDDLPHLTSVCSSNNIFYFPCLEELFVIKCPNMEMFAQVLNTPKLGQVQTGGKEYEWEWEGSLNDTIQALFMKKGPDGWTRLFR